MNMDWELFVILFLGGAIIIYQLWRIIRNIRRGKPVGFIGSNAERKAVIISWMGIVLIIVLVLLLSYADRKSSREIGIVCVVLFLLVAILFAVGFTGGGDGNGNDCGGFG
jgi:hypothetical protein